MKPPNPFKYPDNVLVRKHGPRGYSKYSYYRPWLQDEFDFRCVYCLWRETWCLALSIFEIDHFIAVSVDSELEKNYENLVYSCRNCNNRKSDSSLPNPEKIPFGSCIRVKSNGEVEALNDDGIRLIDCLGLDEKKSTETRKLYIDCIRSFAKHDMSMLYRMMGFPNSMPDLETLEKKPKSNTKIEGIAQSWFQRKQRGELPLIYE